MSRGPLDVLREAARICDEMARCRLFDHQAAQERVVSAGLHEAIAQIEALVAAGSALLSYRVGNYPRRGDLIDTDASRAQIDAFATSIAPFTPGQDSEGGGSSYDGLCPDCREIECSDECLTTQHPEGGDQ